MERLIDRVQSSTLLEDRRDGCRALKAMSRKYRVLVGAHGMDTLLQVGIYITTLVRLDGFPSLFSVYFLFSFLFFIFIYFGSCQE